MFRYGKYLLLIFTLATVWVWAEEPLTIPTRTRAALLNFDYRSQRNITFTVPETRDKAYHLAKTLLLEMDYVPTAAQEERGDLIGPMISKRLFRSNKLAEVLMVRLLPATEGTDITARGLYVVPGSDYIVDQSKSRPSWAIRHFGELYAAKKKVVETTNIYSLHELLASLRDNVSRRENLEETLATLELVETATISRSLAGRQARELIHVVRSELKKQEKLEKSVSQLRERIDQATARGDWLEAHLAADELIHVLLNHSIDQESTLFVETLSIQDRARRRLARKAPLIVFDPVTTPADGNRLALKFTVLNVLSKPITSFGVTVKTTDGAGKPISTRIDPGEMITVHPRKPIDPNEYYDAVVLLRFGEQAGAVHTRIRIVKIRH